MNQDKKDLLFLCADDASPQKVSASATLAWLAEEVQADFDTYITLSEGRRHDGISMSTNGNWHLEQFCFTSHFFNVRYCGLSNERRLPFRRQAAAIGEELAVMPPDKIAEFYLRVFERYGRPIPDTAVMIPAGKQFASDEEEERAPLWIEPFCFPEVLHRKALGVSDRAPEQAWQMLKERGVRRVLAVYCAPEAIERVKELGFDVEVVDSVREDDTYGTLTRRIADRWVDQTETMGYGDQAIVLGALGFYLRNRALVFYQPTEWQAYIKEISSYAEKIGTHLVWGNQSGKPGTDNIITEFGKYDLSMSLGISVVGVSVREKIKLAPGWLEQAQAPWENEYSDDFLEQQAERGGIPVCYLMYAADLGHLPGFARLFDMLAMWYARCGLAFPSTWYDYQAEALEEMYIPHQLGGVFPRVEPLVSSTGVGVGTEAKGFMTRETLRSQIQQGMDSIREHVGSRLVPIGYLSWQDACPYYKHGTGEPQWDVIEGLGFDYCVTYLHEGEEPRIVYQNGSFTAINKQNVHWRGDDGMLNHTQMWEKRLAGQVVPGWILIDFDAPFWFQIPHYFDPVFPTHYQFQASVLDWASCLRYVESGGTSGKLFIAKPHEVVRYARLLKNKGLL